MIEFRSAPHTYREGENGAPIDIIEVWVNGKMVAAIYPNGPNEPNGPNGIRLLSRHIQTMEREQTEDLLNLEIWFEG